MGTNIIRPGAGAIGAIIMMITARSAFGLGAEYPNGQPVGGSSAWPEGLKELVNSTNRIHGYFVNAEDIFFFSGSATNLAGFLRDFATIKGVEKHRLILHEGTGEVKSPWSKSAKRCDWKLYACPKSWLTKDAKEKAFILEVHFWTGGKISLEHLAIPPNVEVTKAKDGK